MSNLRPFAAIRGNVPRGWDSFSTADLHGCARMKVHLMFPMLSKYERHPTLGATCLAPIFNSLEPGPAPKMSSFRGRFRLH
ncbi:MAG: hypothetical protein ACREP2_03915, partial [Rhodanobacteraceae bacterium]